MHANLEGYAYINYLCHTLFITIKILMRTYQYLEQNSTKILMQCLGLSRLDYCKLPQIDLKEYHLDNLQYIQNIACFYYIQSLLKGSHIRFIDRVT